MNTFLNCLLHVFTMKKLFEFQDPKDIGNWIEQNEKSAWKNKNSKGNFWKDWKT